ncbi:MAG: hypothetical protein JWM25_1904 [Thermoleophilia bacterium]|nr:hypothetical protein [Thermoleophilia bacterium]MCZ4497319.1 hypothetical protein [Thermoleophilia bacterium]
MLIARPQPREEGAALLAAIAMLIFASLVIVGIVVGARTTSDASREKLDSSGAIQMARDAGAALSTAYSSLTAGEFDGYAPSQSVLAGHAQRMGGTIVANGSLPQALATVDTARVPASSRYAVRQSLQDGRTGWWQVYSMKLPTWGTTPGGRVIAYVRVWTSPQGDDSKVTQPAMYRIEFRPQWFADYQMLFDGPARILDGATIAGPVHSNGYDNSYYDQYRSLVNAGQTIRFEGTASCTNTARITVASGSVVGNAQCQSQSRSAPNVRYSLLRARDAATRLRVICQGVPHAAVRMSCPAVTTPINVTLSGTQVQVQGQPTLDARVTGSRPSDNQGAVVIASGDVHVRGSLSANARALIITAANTTTGSYGTGSAPSIWIKGGGNVGSNPAASSSFGAVAEGDIIFDETAACGMTMRGALLAMSGMVSSHPTWRSPVPVPSGRTCAQATIRGSITGHYPPLMYNQDNAAGFQRRNYEWLPSLYDNPPPLYPTSADWETTQLEPANLDCFASAVGGALIESRGDCV